MKPNRREFTLMGAGSVLTALTASSPLESMAIHSPETGSSQTISPAQPGHEPWYHRIKRIGQTNFNERDPLVLESDPEAVEKWADYWASAKVQAVALSVSGPIAFYPTAIPFFHRSAWLNDRDLFGECVRAAKKRGLRVYARMSPDIQWTDPRLLEAHPLWFRRNQDGSLQSSAPDIAFTCQFGGHFTEQQPAILRELNARYEIDGVYMNGWPTMQVCYCENCRKVGDPHSPEYRAALLAGAKQLIDHYKQIVLEKSPDNFYSCNLGGGLKEWGLDQWQLTRDALWFTADNQARSGVIAPVWQDAQQVKFAHALMAGRPVAAVTASYTRGGSIAWRNVADSSVEPVCRMAQTAAAGGIVWYHWLGLEQGLEQDRRWQKPGREFLNWHARHDQHFHNLASLARVAIVISTRSTNLYDAPASADKSADSTDAIQGIYAVLVEARIPFDLVHEEDLNPQRLNRYSTLILPNVALLSDTQCRSLEQYVEQGGSLVATFETGLYNETGKPRPDFALGSLFGIRKTGPRSRSEAKSTDPMTSVHLQSIRQPVPRRHAITAGFEETTWIAGTEWNIPLAPIPDPILTSIEPYPVYPPEAVFQRQPPSDSPTVVLKEKGKSRLAYLSGDIDAGYWRLDNADLGLLLRNVLAWVMRDTNPITVTGEGLIELCAWQTEPGFAIHLLNYNGPNAFRGRMRTPVTLGPQTVRLTLPQDARVKRATLLHAETPLEFRQQGRTVEFTIPSVGAYEVAALEV